MKQTFLTILLLSMLVISPTHSKESPHPAEQIVHVVLLAGQSNMGGAGNYDELPPSIIKRIENVAQRVNISVSGDSPKPLSYETSKFHQEKYGISNKFGPELFFALTLAEKHPTREYLLIKTARGGTSLYGAWNSQWTAEKAQAVERGKAKQNLKLYELHLSYVQQNLARLQQEGKSYHILGMLWMQGENDAGKEPAARSYQSNLIKLINGYRNELAVKDMPFIIGQINSTYGRFKEGPEMVRAAMAEVAKTLPNTALIGTSTERSWSDFPKHSDNTHYNTEGQIRLGKEFANALSTLSKLTVGL